LKGAVVLRVLLEDFAAWAAKVQMKCVTAVKKAQARRPVSVNLNFKTLPPSPNEADFQLTEIR
jgi:hypothetical protein